MVEAPFFMTDDAWYYFSAETMRYELTDEAPEEARKSLREWREDVENDVVIE